MKALETGRKKVEERIRVQSELSINILDHLPYPFYVVDAKDYTIKMTNSTALGGTTSKDLTCYALSHNTSQPCRDPAHPCPLEQVKKTGKARVVEHVHFDKNGNITNVEVHVYPVFDNNGNVIQVIEYCLDITERKQAEEALGQRTHDLGERVKELNCLYGISSLVEKKDILLERILEVAVNLIPPSWQYPEVTCARIILDGQTFQSKNFQESVWKQTSGITVHGKKAGTVEVFYLEKRPKRDEGPFFKEERNLIHAIAEHLGRITERKQAE